MQCTDVMFAAHLGTVEKLSDSRLRGPRPRLGSQIRARPRATFPAVKPLTVTLDREADAAYVYLARIEPKGVARTVPTENDTVMLDFDAAGRLVGIEVLGAQKRLPAELLALAVPAGSED